MKTLGNLISNLFNGLGMEDRLRLESIREEWHNIFNEPLSLHTCPVELNSGELLINVDSPIWLQQLKFFKKDITSKLGNFGVKTIKFRHGKVFGKKTRGRESRAASSDISEKNLSDSDRNWIEETVSAVDDFEVKETIRKALVKSLARKK